MDPDRRRLLHAIRHRYDIVAHTHKTHEKERELVANRITSEKRLRLILTILNSSFVGGGALAVVSGILSPPAMPEIPAGISAIAAGISALVAINKLASTPEDLVHVHKAAANSQLKERNELFHLIEECMSSDYSIKQIREKLQTVEGRLAAMYPLLPDTSDEAYDLAKEALATGGEGASPHTEIDSLLPESFAHDDSETTSSDSSDDSDDSDVSRLIGFA